MIVSSIKEYHGATALSTTDSAFADGNIFGRRWVSECNGITNCN
jgi:hypothetical protein